MSAMAPYFGGEDFPDLMSVNSSNGTLHRKNRSHFRAGMLNSENVPADNRKGSIASSPHLNTMLTLLLRSIFGGEGLRCGCQSPVLCMFLS